MVEKLIGDGGAQTARSDRGEGGVPAGRSGEAVRGDPPAGGARADRTGEGARSDRGERKRAEILLAATEAFLRNGYLGTSMDEVAAAAKASKQTVYKHFADKETLFSEIVRRIVDEIADPNTDALMRLSDAGDLAAGLHAFARRQIHSVTQPRLLQLRRLVIGEAGRFPHLGRLYYDRGPGRTIDALAVVFEGLRERGELQFDDARIAAAHFNWLVMSIPLNASSLLGSDEPATAEELDRYADAGVDAFLAAYSRR